MATHALPILGWQCRPDDTGEAFFEPADLNFGSNDLARQFILALGSALAAQPTVKHGVYGAFSVPENYIGTTDPLLVIQWASTVTSGDVVFDFDYRAVDAAESYDPATWQQSLTVTDTASGTARNFNATNITVEGDNLDVGKHVLFFLGRDGAAGADTMAGRAYLIGASLLYNDA